MILTKRQAFLEFNKEYQDLKESEKSEFSKICNKLLQVNFITRRKKDDENHYRFILGYKQVFEAFFALIDFELEIKRENEVCFIRNEGDYNRLRLKKTDSILLLILRVLFQKKKDQITLSENVKVFLYEIHDELTRIGYLDNKRINKNELKPALVMFRNYNIIDYVDTGLHDDCQIVIYPTILYVTNVDNMKAVINQIDNYVSDGKIPLKEFKDSDNDEKVN